MRLRFAATISLVAVVALASGCVQERVVHDRPVVVERPVVQPEYVEVVAPQPPPPRIVEEVQPRPGYVWIHGYWRWNGRGYVAEHGHWEAARPGYHYVHPHWERRNDGWHLHVGAWLSD